MENIVQDLDKNEQMEIVGGDVVAAFVFVCGFEAGAKTVEIVWDWLFG